MSEAEAPGRPAQVALSRELGEFLIELAIALQKHGMYPEGHPSLEAVADSVVDRLEALFQERTALSLGVAREQLVIEGVATDAQHPVLRQLAKRLHSHYLGAVKLLPGVDPEELASVLRALASDPRQKESEPLGLSDADAERWPHVRLFPIAMDLLHLVQEEGGDRSRTAQLWVELARAAVAAESETEVPTDPSVIARAIEQRPESSGYDQVIVGYLLEITRELRAGGGEAHRALKRRVQRLVRDLSPKTLKRLVRMGGDLAQQRSFMQGAAEALSCDAVVKLLQAAGDAAARPVSESLLRILSKLALQAEQEDAAGQSDADAELRRLVTGLVEGWELDDPNPSAYGIALAGMARSQRGGTPTPEATDGAEPERVLQMCLEADATGPLLGRALDRLLEERRAPEIFAAIDDAPASDAVAVTWKLLAEHDRFELLLRQPDLGRERTQPLLAGLGKAAVPLLLDTMSESEDRSSRRTAFDLLVGFGEGILPEVEERLDDDRWFVLRNLLALYNALGTVPEGGLDDRFLSHTDARVRREAVKIGFREPGRRSEVLRAALGDTDERVLQMGLVAALDGIPDNIVVLVLARAKDDSLQDTIRATAVRVLGQVDQPVALRTLIELACEKKKLLGGVKLRTGTPVTVSAVRALAEGWADHPKAKPVLERARASRDQAFREAAERGTD